MGYLKSACPEASCLYLADTKNFPYGEKTPEQVIPATREAVELVNNFKDLVVWQKAMDYVVLIYEMTGLFPSDEKYGITNQMRRAAVSIPSNIAEGQVKMSDKEFIRFLLVSKGSCAELETQLLLCVRLHYIENEKADQMISMVNDIGKMISGLIISLQNKKQA